MFQSYGGSPFSRGLLPAHKGFLRLTSGGLVLLMASSIAVDSFSNSELITAPKRSLGQGNIFTPVCHSVHRGGLPQCMLGYHPPGPGTPPPEQTPQEQTPPPRAADTPPGTRHPPGANTPLEADPPGANCPPPLEQTPPSEQSILGDMVNERAVRILLECNLVRQFDKLI